MTPEDVRRTVEAWGAEERPHHGIPSWRTPRRIFATLPDEQTLRVMLDEGGIRAAVAEFPDWCAEQWWGKRLAAVRVSLPDADPEVVAELLRDAWEAAS